MARVCAPVAALVCVLVGTQTPDAAQDGAAADVDVVGRTAEYVESYLAAARTILAREEVVLQPLDASLRPSDRPRRLTYETRLEWDPSVETARAAVRRELATVDGRPARAGDEEGCLPEALPEPLVFLLPARRGDYRFEPPRAIVRDDRPAWQVAFAPVGEGTASIDWTGDCGRLDLPGYLRGSLMVDGHTFAVLRLDQALTRPVDIFVPPHLRRPGWAATITAERADSSVVYAPVRFRDPDETVLLPREVRHLTIVRAPEVRRLSVVQRWSEYRRFTTGGRVVPMPR